MKNEENQMVIRISEDCAEIAMQYFTEQLHKLSIGGLGSEVRSEGEQLGNEAGGKSVCDGNEMYALGYKAGFDKGYNIGLADGRA